MEEVTYRLVVISGLNTGHTYQLAAEESIGRSAGNSIVLPAPEISRRHARLWRAGGRYYLEDLGSTNGSFVNNNRVQKAVALTDGDTVRIGDTYQLLFTAQEPAIDAGAVSLLEGIEPAKAPPPVYEQEPAVEPLPGEIPTPKPPLFTELDEQVYGGTPSTAEDPRRRLILWCGCLPLLLILACTLTLVFLDSYQQGQLLYCGPLRFLFELLLGPLGFNPVCP